MKYRDFGETGLKVSALGFGAMRLPTVNNEPYSSNIIEEEAIGLIRQAIDQGVNYVDTAYPYHGGASEILVGKALQDGYREKVYLATKSPLFKLNTEEDFERILDEQLEKLQTNCIDFYLLHAVNKEKWQEKVLKFNLLSKLEKAKSQGKIKYIGFSFHDNLETFKEVVDGYEHWDFCQIQLNYIDVVNQAGMEGLKYAAERGLAVVIMEPLLGGRLAAPPAQVAKLIPQGKSPVQYAFDFLWDMKEVSLLLSGMGSKQMVEDNLAYADEAAIGKLTEEDAQLYKKVKHVYDNMALVPCTKCSYCMPCPFGLDIPKIYEAYNKTAIMAKDKAKEFYEALSVKADSCRKCKKCEKVCPQHIISSDLMPVIDEAFKSI